jgi:HPt (histidine-containing phosphotransfer) domain-containing protein
LVIPAVEGRSGAILRPGGITYDVGEEFEAYATELARNEDAAGVAASRNANTRSAGLRPQADDARHLTSTHSSEVERALSAYSTAHDDLGSFVRRRPKDNRRYSVTRWVLLGADTGAVLGALIYVGEVPLLALGTALAVGLSGVTAGMVGGDVRELKLARERRALAESDEIDADLVRRYPRLFGAVDPAKDTYGLALKSALLVVVFVGLGVFGIRAALEGLLGVAFFGFAMAVALASFISSWVHADDVADVLEVFEARLSKALARQRALAGAPQPSAQDAHAAEAASIQTEHQIRGEAKAAGVRALKHEVYRRHPQVFGHGTAEFRTARLVPVDLADLSELAEIERRDGAAGTGIANAFQSNGHPPF